MPTLMHPTIPGVTQDVQADEVRDWQTQGWVLPAKEEQRTTTAPRRNRAVTAKEK